jgi:hypothetical protein
MKQIRFNNKDYSIPENWNEVNVGMVIKASELDELLPDAPVIAIMSAYTGIPVGELSKGKANEVSDILAIMDFIKDEYKPIPATRFTLDNIEYNCEEELTNQKFEDFVSIQTALFNYKEEPYRALPKLIAILCKRDNETLSDFDLTERTELMRKLPLTEAKNIEAFFLHSLNAYKALTLISSTQDIQKEIVLAKVQELKSTMKIHKGRTGIFSGMRFRIGIWQIQLWWVEKVLEKYFSTQSTSNSKRTWIQICKNWLTRTLKRNKN